MEIKELMKGDKIGVRSNDGYDLHIFTVSEIKENGISCGKDFVYYDFDEIEAIPFAEEIFEKNEFKRHTFNGTIIYSKKSFVDIDWYDVDVEIGKDAEGIQRWDCVCIKIQKAGADLRLNNQSCFHQLQHALRLVGLTEMADNLIV